jgi:hypothetical protein
MKSILNSDLEIHGDYFMKILAAFYLIKFS